MMQAAFPLLYHQLDFLTSEFILKLTGTVLSIFKAFMVDIPVDCESISVKFSFLPSLRSKFSFWNTVAESGITDFSSCTKKNINIKMS